ncbi:hypothetical protein HK098_006581 [Nowakowskiella sp. JEL0407]|nr:hypothetical protein HK098_006581 [Nowakowskiella sp. JEL0407]
MLGGCRDKWATVAKRALAPTKNNFFVNYPPALPPVSLKTIFTRDDFDKKPLSRVHYGFWASAAFLCNAAADSLLAAKYVPVDTHIHLNSFSYDAVILESDLPYLSEAEKLLKLSDSLLSDTPPTDPSVYTPLFQHAQSSIHNILNSDKVTSLDVETNFKVKSTSLDFVYARKPFEVAELPYHSAIKLFAHNPFKLALLSQFHPSQSFLAIKCDNYIDLLPGCRPDTDIPILQSAKTLMYIDPKHSGSVSFPYEFSPSAAKFIPSDSKSSQQPISRQYAVAFGHPVIRTAYNEHYENLSQRDHRVIGKQQELFLFHPYSPGSVIMLPHGMRIAQRLVDALKMEYKSFGFDEVSTPIMFNKRLWEESGHWMHYKDDMFVLNVEGGEESQLFSLKPMNCPGHCLIYLSHPRTATSLPIRLSEFTPLHRNESSGSLSGLSRVRKFSQDDAHIFCREDQIEQELESTLRMVDSVYGKMLKLEYEVLLSTRPDGKKSGDADTAVGDGDGGGERKEGEEKTAYLGTDEEWNRAEKILGDSLKKFGHKFEISKGDGAFYAPKIDIIVKDAMGRSHQTATIQLDYQLPRRFDLGYEGGSHVPVVASGGDGQVGCAPPDGEKKGKGKGVKRPVLIHRAVLGSVERMMAILTEHYAGRWPFWLNPRQAMVIPVFSNDKDLVDPILFFLWIFI